MALELRHLRYFIAVAEHLNFTRAAADLHMAQPSLSVQIANLEYEIGTALFVRGARGVDITAAGQEFLKSAQQILELARRSIDTTRRVAKGEIGQLAIGHNTPTEFRIFPRILPGFRENWPNVSLQFHNMRNLQQINMLRKDELQIGFVWLPAPSGEFDVHELERDKFTAVLPVDHPLAKKSSVPVLELAKEPLIMFTRALDPSSSLQISGLFHKIGVEMNVAFEMENVLSTLNFISMGYGCSILPSYIREVGIKGVAYRNISPNFVLKLAMIKKKNSTPLTNAFFSHAITANEKTE